MKPAAFETACLDLPGASKVVQWGGASVYKVGPRMFAIAGLSRGGGTASYVFRVSEMAYELLIEQGLAGPAPYLRAANWVRLASQEALSDDDLRAYLRQAHALVAAKLTRAQRAALGLAPRPAGV